MNNVLDVARPTFNMAIAGARTPPISAIADVATAAQSIAKPVIVLVHGAFADAARWQHVILLLEKDGYTVFAVHNSLFSLDDDVATTKRVIKAQTGPVIVVGHSYGGAVITGAAAGEPNVKALVYLAAFAPDVNEPVGAYLQKYPTELGTSLVVDAGRFAYIDRAKFQSVFCADVPAAEENIMAVTQKPLSTTCFTATLPVAAWRTIPS